MPPERKIPRPASVASGEVVLTIPFVPYTTLLVRTENGLNPLSRIALVDVVPTAAVGVEGRLEVGCGDAEAAHTLRDLDCVRPIATDSSIMNL